MNEIDKSANVDVEALKVRAREDAERRKASRPPYYIELMADAEIEDIDTGALRNETAIAGGHFDAINQIPVTAGGLKGALERRLKKVIKWLVHWNTKPQAEFNHSVVRSLWIIAAQIETLQESLKTNDIKSKRRYSVQSQQSDMIEKRIEKLIEENRLIERQLKEIREQVAEIQKRLKPTL